MAPAAQLRSLSESGTSQTGPLFALACAQILVFGVVMALPGALLPELAPRLGFGLARAGALFFVLNAAMLGASVVVGVVIDRAGFRVPAIAGPLLAGAAMATMAVATNYLELLPAMILLGLGGGALNASSNTLTADIHPEPGAKNAALNRLGVFFGIGALSMPLLTGALLSSLGSASLLGIAAFACLLVSLAGALPRYPAPKKRGDARTGVGDLLRQPLIWMFGILLLFQSGNEMLLAGYLSTYLATALGLSLSAASFALAGYWAAILAARLLWSRLLLRVEGGRLVVASAAAATVLSAVLAAAPTPAVALLAVPVLGFSLAGIFPTTLGLAGARYPTRSGSVFGLLFAMALVGGMSLPWVAGQLGELSGVRAAMAVAPAGFLVIAGLAAAAARRARQEMYSEGGQ